MQSSIFINNTTVKPKLFDYYVCISIILLMLSHPCRFIEEHVLSMIGQPMYILRSFYMMNLFLIAYAYREGIFLSKLQKKIFVLFIISLLYILFLSQSLYAQVEGVRGTGSFLALYYAILIMLIINNKRFNFSLFINLWIRTAFVFSLLAVIQFIALKAGFISLYLYQWKTYAAGSVQMMNFGGYFSQEYGSGLHRVLSYWSEPARFAQFLVIPLFISYLKTKNITNSKNYFTTSIIFLAFLLTFSVANFFGLIFAISLYYLVQLFRAASNINLFKMTIFLVLLTATVLFGSRFYEITDSYGGDSIIGKHTSINLENRRSRFEIALQALDNSFFGDPQLSVNYGANPTALGTVIINGGIPLLLLSIAYTFLILSKILNLRTLMNAEYILVYVGFLAYFIAFNWYGNYQEPLYFIILIIMSYFIKIDLSKKVKHENIIIN